VAHGVTEEWLNAGRAPTHLIGQKRFVGEIETGHLVSIDDEMLHYAGECVDRCEFEPGEQFVEVHVDFSHLTPIPNQGGTADFIAVLASKERMLMADHKFGASPENIVYPEDNTQLMLYAIGAWRLPQFTHLPFNDFIIRINQPRLNHFDDWHTTASRLAEFEAYARERMALAWQLDAPRIPGPKQCRFCKVRSTCAANAKMQEDLISAVFSDETQTVEQMQDFVRRLDDDLDTFKMHFRSSLDLTTAQLAKLKPYRGMAESWWKSMAAELDRRAARGEKIPGYKVVEGRSRRKFISETQTREHLLALGLKRKDIIEESLVSPAQAEKLLRKAGHKTKELPELLQGLVFKPPGRATLAPLSDRRPEVEDVSALVFEGDESANREDEEI
jgi:hypothetical protein